MLIKLVLNGHNAASVPDVGELTARLLLSVKEEAHSSHDSVESLS